MNELDILKKLGRYGNRIEFDHFIRLLKNTNLKREKPTICSSCNITYTLDTSFPPLIVLQGTITTRKYDCLGCGHIILHSDIDPIVGERVRQQFLRNGYLKY